MIVQPCTILFSEQKGNIKNIIIMQPCSAQLLQLLLHTQLRLILIIMITLNFAIALILSVLEFHHCCNCCHHQHHHLYEKHHFTSVSSVGRATPILFSISNFCTRSYRYIALAIFLTVSVKTYLEVGSCADTLFLL